MSDIGSASYGPQDRRIYIPHVHDIYVGIGGGSDHALIVVLRDVGNVALAFTPAGYLKLANEAIKAYGMAVAALDDTKGGPTT